VFAFNVVAVAILHLKIKFIFTPQKKSLNVNEVKINSRGMSPTPTAAN
jgi:hypothetical protein